MTHSIAEGLTQCLCSLFNNIKPPSWLPMGSDFHLFKQGIEPKWEDPQCLKGGSWTLHIPKGQNAKAELDKHWLDGVRVAFSGNCWSAWLRKHKAGNL